MHRDVCGFVCGRVQIWRVGERHARTGSVRVGSDILTCLLGRAADMSTDSGNVVSPKAALDDVQVRKRIAAALEPTRCGRVNMAGRDLTIFAPARSICRRLPLN